MIFVAITTPKNSLRSYYNQSAGNSSTTIKPAVQVGGAHACVNECVSE